MIISITKVVECLLYLGIGAIAILFIYKGGDIEQYQSKATNFKIKEMSYTKKPVITICPSHWFEGTPYFVRSYKYGIDFNISIGSIIADLGSNSIKCSDFNGTDGSDYTYDDCDYVLDESDEHTTSFVLEEVYSIAYGLCYKIVHDPDTIYDWKSPFQTLLIYNTSIPFEILPKEINVFITSDANSYGIIFSTWMDGNELRMRFLKVSLFSLQTYISDLSHNF